MTTTVREQCGCREDDETCPHCADCFRLLDEHCEECGECWCSDQECLDEDDKDDKDDKDDDR